MVVCLIWGLNPEVVMHVHIATLLPATKVATPSLANPRLREFGMPGNGASEDIFLAVTFKELDSRLN